MDNIPNGHIADISIRLCFSYGPEKSRQCRRSKLSVNDIVPAAPLNPVIRVVSPIIFVDFLEEMEGTRSDSVLQIRVSIFPVYFPLSHAALQDQGVSSRVYAASYAPSYRLSFAVTKYRCVRCIWRSSHASVVQWSSSSTARLYLKYKRCKEKREGAIDRALRTPRVSQKRVFNAQTRTRALRDMHTEWDRIIRSMISTAANKIVYVIVDWCNIINAFMHEYCEYSPWDSPRMK